MENKTRLTEKRRHGHYKISVDLDKMNNFDAVLTEIVEKLGRLEDIEDELGIDLTTLYEALKNGVYYRNNQKQINFAKSERVYLSHKSLRVDYHTYKYLKDYGKTWSLDKKDLTKEEL